jgi:hypothetical protein
MGEEEEEVGGGGGGGSVGSKISSATQRRRRSEILCCALGPSLGLLALAFVMFEKGCEKDDDDDSSSQKRGRLNVRHFVQVHSVNGGLNFNFNNTPPLAEVETNSEVKAYLLAYLLACSPPFSNVTDRL